MKKKLNIAIQMDPLENLTLAGDTTFLLAFEAQRRNFDVFHYTPNDLVYKSGNIYARMKSLNLSYHNDGESFKYGKESLLDLSVIIDNIKYLNLYVNHILRIQTSSNVFPAAYAIIAWRCRNDEE